MNDGSTGARVADLTDVARLEEIVDRAALSDLCRSFFDLFGLSVRVLSADGAVLADVHEEREVCAYVNETPGGRTACGRIVGEARSLVPDGRGHVVHGCFTGAVYRVVPITYQARQLGRIVLGPYLPAELDEVPRSLLEVDPEIDASEALATLEEMPRVRRETAERLADHIQRTLELLVFGNHRAHLASEMHVLSARESYRELAEKNAELRRAYERLKELDRLKSNFLATVSHELRTPLTSILGYSEMLASGMAGELQPEQLEFVQTIHSKGELLLRLISSLLDLGKLEQGNLSLEREPINPLSLLEDLASTVLPMARKKGVTVTVEPALGPLPRFEADPVRLRQVLGNLLDNALKFTRPDGHIHLGVRVTELDMGPDGDDDGGAGMVLLAAPRRALEFHVKDDGIGIPPSEHEKIFDPFYQVDGSSTREHGGTGLGLSIVKRLVEAHGGTIRVESAPGRGTTFYVTIPEADDA
jgi:signal transduction histidine kinase